MGLAKTIESWFDAKVRRRGDEYFDWGAAEVIEHSPTHVELDVEGSYDDYYSVIFDWSAGDAVKMECTCPHFEDGNYCKHLWASARTIDRMKLFGQQVAQHFTQTANNKEPSKPLAVSAWRKQLARHNRRFQPFAPPSVDSSQGERSIFYVIELVEVDDALVIQLHQRQRRKDGEWGKLKPLCITAESIDELNAPQDEELVRLLIGNQVWQDREYYPGFDYHDSIGSLNGSHATRVKLARPLYDTILPRLCETGRVGWVLSTKSGLDDLALITWDDGPAWQFRIRATPADRNRKWKLSGEIVRGETITAMHDVVHCFSQGLLLWCDTLARFDPPRDLRWINMLRENPTLEVPQADRGQLLAELWWSGESPVVVGDKSLQLESEKGTPRGRLVVHPPRELPKYARDDKYLYASVSYDYDGHQASPASDTHAWLSPCGTRMLCCDLTAESVLMQRLLDLSLVPKERNYYGTTPAGHMQFLPRELNTIVETLVGEGWVVEAEGAKIRKGSSFSISIKSGIDWFDVEGHADFDGTQVALPELLAALRHGERYITLDDGTKGLLPQEWLERYAPLADLSAKQQDGTLRFQPGQALLLDALLSSREADIDIQVDRTFSTLRKRLQSFTGVKPAAAPREFKGELRDYQKDGLGWLKFLEKFSFGGCLADDMGLGKTIQVLALLANRRRRQPKDVPPRPSIVIAPKSLVYNWRLEAERFAPKLNVVEFTGTDRHDRVPEFDGIDLVLTTFGTLRRDIERLADTDWDYAILDEAQAIKNAASQSAKASRLLKARHRLALSGTPVENHLGELWSIFEFLNPGMLGRSDTLRKLSRGTDGEDDGWIESLRRGLAPFLLRRNKQHVLPQLPKKTEQHLYCDLPASQRKQYNQIRDHYRASLDKKIASSGLAQSKIHVLEALLRLRQAACHPGLIDKSLKKKPSAKLDLLIEQLTEVIDEGHKALVFSQFTSMLEIVKSRLNKAGVVYEYLDGKTRDRQARIERFQSDESCSAFLISLKAGGAGLNLTAADFVFLLDPWWNPAVEAQAIDRVHRIGQEKPVFAYRLIARDTVEEKILELQAKKSDLANAIISGDSSLLKKLSADDLTMLLS